jgi:outer membrane protein TolC
LTGCAATPIPPAETPYYAEQLAIARAAPAAPAPGAEAAALREAASKLEVRAAAESDRIRRGDETEGLLDVEAPAAREFLAKLADAARAEEVLATTPLDVEHAFLAVYARNPDVAAARADWSASLRAYETANYLEDLLLRYSAFTRAATPSVGAAPMRESAFPYPGLVALKGEMIDREVAIARETARMRLRDALVAASRAWHVAVHQGEEAAIRGEQLSLAKRLVESARARVASGRSPQAEVLDMEAEVATAENERRQAESSLARARAELNTLLARDPQAPLTLHEHLHADPPEEATPVEPLLELARRWSPEIRVARAEAARSAAAIRMSEATLFAAATPDAMKGGEPATPAFGADAAWLAELRERHVALQRAAEEAVKAAERRVLDAHFEMDARRRAYLVAAKHAEPLSRQSVGERQRLYESGRAEFADLVASYRRRLDAEHDAVAARHDYFLAEATLWTAVGARPELVRAAREGDER